MGIKGINFVIVAEVQVKSHEAFARTLRRLIVNSQA
jgi:hypothetical protein